MTHSDGPRTGRPQSKQVLGTTVGAVAVVAAAGLVVLRSRVGGYTDPWHAKIAAAGYVEKTAQINQVSLSYVEGPDNGPPLVLLHAQHMDWFSYSRVLPELARSFHVFDVDYPGHGQTTVPDDYPMTANQIGSDLGDFIGTVVQGPAYVTGNSSGRLLSTWLAANRPDLVRSVVLEDPPLFSAEYPRIKQTIADRSFATCQQAVDEGVDDFLLYWVESNSAFFKNNVGRGSDVLLKQAIRSYRRANPGKPAEIGLLPNTTARFFVRGLDQNDPRFGAAFHDGTWNEGFDHAEALAKITCPTLLLQADYTMLDDGTLNGAMTREDADRAMSLLPGGTYRKVDASHVVHLDEPEQFTQIVEDFFLGGGR